MSGQGENLMLHFPDLSFLDLRSFDLSFLGLSSFDYKFLNLLIFILLILIADLYSAHFFNLLIFVVLTLFLWIFVVLSLLSFSFWTLYFGSLFSWALFSVALFSCSFLFKILDIYSDQMHVVDQQKGARQLTRSEHRVRITVDDCKTLNGHITHV